MSTPGKPRVIALEEHYWDREVAATFAPLAIEAYDHVPIEFRAPFDDVINDMNSLIVEAVANLSAMRDDADMLGFTAADYWQRLQALVDRGSAIVHGSVQDNNPTVTMDQSEIDDLF